MKTLKVTLLILLALSLNAELKAQDVKIPQASSGQSIAQDFGLGKITLTYSRPNTKGRKVFGGLEPYGAVWRTGANNATVINFTEDVTFEGQPVPAGEYGLFTIPGKSEWTVILSKNAKQWGAYTYKDSEDILRVKVKPTTLKDKVETFTLQFANVTTTNAQLQLMWDKTALTINLATDVDTKVMANIDAAMQGDKKPYSQAAQYYFQNGKDLNKALEWINAADAAANPKVTYIKLWKARIQLKMGDKKAAVESATEGLKLAKEAKNDEYVRLNSEVLAEAQK